MVEISKEQFLRGVGLFLHCPHCLCLLTENSPNCGKAMAPHGKLEAFLDMRPPVPLEIHGGPARIRTGDRQVSLAVAMSLPLFQSVDVKPG